MTKRVLIFKSGVIQNDHTIVSATIKDSEVPVFMNFDRQKQIGTAKVYTDESGDVYADIEVTEPFTDDNIRGMFPYLGGEYQPNQTLLVKETAIGISPNADNRIGPIE